MMGITNSNKQISTDQIDCSGTLKITLALSAAPDIASNPTDIVLVLDRSGSMTGTPLTNMKAGADTFIDIIDEATDGSQDGTIGSGSRIGIVSFADTASGIIIYCIGLIGDDGIDVDVLNDWATDPDKCDPSDKRDRHDDQQYDSPVEDPGTRRIRK